MAFDKAGLAIIMATRWVEGVDGCFRATGHRGWRVHKGPRDAERQHLRGSFCVLKWGFYREDAKNAKYKMVRNGQGDFTAAPQLRQKREAQ